MKRFFKIVACGVFALVVLGYFVGKSENASTSAATSNQSAAAVAADTPDQCNPQYTINYSLQDYYLESKGVLKNTCDRTVKNVVVHYKSVDKNTGVVVATGEIMVNGFNEIRPGESYAFSDFQHLQMDADDIKTTSYVDFQ